LPTDLRYSRVRRSLLEALKPHEGELPEDCKPPEVLDASFQKSTARFGLFNYHRQIRETSREICCGHTAGFTLGRQQHYTAICHSAPHRLSPSSSSTAYLSAPSGRHNDQG